MKTLLELFAKYQWLEERIGRGLPIPISKERQQIYARRVRRRRSAHIAELPRFRQELETMCFAAVCLGTLIDDMLRLVEIRITAIWTWGHKVVADRLMPARVRKKSELLAELRRLVADKTLTDAAFRAKANSLLLADEPNTLSSRAADVREVLSRNARRIRPILQLLTKLDLQGDGAGGDGLSWLVGIYHDGVETFFADKAATWARRWKTLIEESDTQTSARAYEAATAWAVRQGLRNASLFSKYGFDYADPSSHWMPVEIWKERRSGYQFERTSPMLNICTPSEPKRPYAPRYRVFGRPLPQVMSGWVERTCIFGETKRRYDPRAWIKPKTNSTARSGGYSCRLCYWSLTRKCILAGSCWAASRKAPRNCSVSMVRC